MSFDPYEFDRSYPRQGPGVTVGQYAYRTFLWMFLGLMITFGLSVFLYATDLTLTLFYRSPAAPFLLLFVELALVIVLSSRVRTLSVGAARGLFLAYAAVNGVVISTVLYVYRLDSVVLVFGLTALYFGALAAYGYLTRADLSRLGPILFIGVVFLAVYWLLSLLLPISGMERMISIIGIVVFLGCTAYDTQMIRSSYTYYCGYPDMLEKASIFSALQLYLDFINLFLYLLRFLGSSRRN